MLVELEWDINYGSPNMRQHIVEFDTRNGLLARFKADDGRTYTLESVERIHKGVYCAYGLHGAFRSFTKWTENSSEMFSLMDRVNKTEGTPEFEAARIAFLRSHSEYGTADNLKQVFRHGRGFIRSPEPYVLEVTPLTQDEDGGFRWHKNGPYIGKHKNRGEYFRESPHIDNLVKFHFHRLAIKE